MKLLLIATSFFAFMLVLKLGNVGSVGSWSWWVIFSPFYPSLVLNVVVFSLGSVLLLKRKSRAAQYHGKPLDGSPENKIQEFFRARRAKKHAKMQEKYQ